MSADFYGLPTRSLDNGHLRLDYLANAGPRIVRLFAPGSQRNLMAELPDITMDTPDGPYFIRGGHRLWHSPEAFPRSYLPDNEGRSWRSWRTACGSRSRSKSRPASANPSRSGLRPARPSATLTHELPQ